MQSEQKQLTPAIREGLKRKVEEHNEKVGSTRSKRTNLRTLGAVFRRGIGAYRTNPQSVRPSVRSEEQWAYARVNSFLYVLRNGRYRSGKHDTDLLPQGHPMRNRQKVQKATYKPTQGMVEAAERGLKLRSEQPPSNRGGTAIGLARARDIINGKELSASTVLRMHSFFSRHAIDEQAGGWKPSDDNYPSKGFQAHLLWGGSEGRRWAKRIRDQIMREREKGMKEEEKEMKEEIMKAAKAMEHLLMAYNEMIRYSFEGAHELRSDLMEIIHALEHEIAGKPEHMEGDGMPMMDVETRHYDDDEEKMYEDYKKKIVMEDGQFCVYNADRTRSFGCYISREKAEERLRQIESFSYNAQKVATEQLIDTYLITDKKLSSTNLAVINELIDEELCKRMIDGVQRQSEVNLATIVKAEQRYTMGPVYIPGAEDAHGETIDSDELQKSIWEWVRNGDRTIYLQHSEKPAGEMVEIMTMPMQTEMSLVVPGEGVTKYKFPTDTPFMGVIWEDWAWDLVKAGKLRGYSIGGQAQRVEVELPL